MIIFSSLAMGNLSIISHPLEGFVLHFLFFLLIVFVTATIILLFYLFFSHFKEFISEIKNVDEDADVGIKKLIGRPVLEKTKKKNLPVLKKKNPEVDINKIDETFQFIDEKGEMPVKNKDDVMEGGLIMGGDMGEEHEEVIADVQEKKGEKQYDEAIDEALDLATSISKKYMEFAASRKDDFDE
ncbi:MAG: hypothetical protein R6U17_09735 [Thermoplasmata archaeon]